ncbi:MAG: hypothetical protein PVJ60_06330 [Phycisphaerales bacterium]|jgi:hypothetical protein
MQYQGMNQYDIIAAIFDSYLKGTQAAQKSNFESRILNDYMAGRTPNMQQDQPQGFLGKLGNVFNPSGSYQGGLNELSPITRNVLLNMRSAPIEEEYMKARTETEKARGKYYEQGGGRTTVTVKPFSPNQMQTEAKRMDSYIDQAYERDIGDPDYTQEKLIEQWQNYKEAVGWDSLATNQKKQLWQDWNTLIAKKGKDTVHLWGLAGGNEFEWDPESQEVAAAGPEKGPMPNQSPDIGEADPYEDAVQQARRQLPPDATEDEILNLAQQILMSQ